MRKAVGSGKHGWVCVVGMGNWTLCVRHGCAIAMDDASFCVLFWREAWMVGWMDAW